MKEALIERENEKNADETASNLLTEQNVTEYRLATKNALPPRAGADQRQPENEIAAEHPPEASADDAALPETPQFSVVLEEISHAEPEISILQDYLSGASNAELRRLDVTKFLSFENEAVAMRDVTLRRRSLHLILCAENLVRTAVNRGLNFEQQDEALSLVGEMQTLGSSLSLAMYEVAGEGDKEKTDCLLYAANNLMAARLRLNPLIDKPRPQPEKFVKSEPANNFTVQPKPIGEAKTEIKPVKKTDRKPKPKSSRWLIAAAVLIGAVGAAFYVVASFNETASATVRQARNVDLQQLNGSENLVVAKVNSETLVCITDKNWKDLSLEKKNENLRRLVGDGSRHQYKSVLLIDSRGNVVANARENQINLK